MKFALVNDVRAEPKPKLHGKCRYCGSDMISKCGKIKIWHWAHKSRRNCDAWWENETQWHRDWKNQFPSEWQEVIHFDERTGEKHIADVKSPSGLVVEFQHSPIQYEELQSREQFYGDMIWIVNGSRNDFDAWYLKMGLGLCTNPIQNNPLRYSVNWCFRSRLLHKWSFSQKRVFLDFGVEMPDLIWRLYSYDREQNIGVIAAYPKHSFIQSIINGEGIDNLPDITLKAAELVEVT